MTVVNINVVQRMKGCRAKDRNKFEILKAVAGNKHSGKRTGRESDPVES